MIASAPEWQRMVVLAPVFVVGAGLIAAVIILIIRAGIDSWRQSEHKRLLIWGLLGLCALVVLLTYLGVSIPNTE